jgi:dienelactone hydrolase
MGKGLSGLLLAAGLGLACGLTPGGPTPEADLAGLAEKFSRQFLDGKHEANLQLMTKQMKAASGPGPSEQLRSALVAQHGAVVDVDAAWLEDRLQGYLRFRVPVRFERGTFDFRVVFDGAGRLAGFFIVPHAEPPDARDTGPGKRVDVRIGPGDTALPGTLTLPDGEGPFPAVVLVHGSGPQDRDETSGPNKPFRDLASGLAERDIASLRYDKRSYARPEDLVASGDGLTVRQEVIEDARHALELLRGRDEIDGTRLYLIGHSLGGTVLPRIAAAEPRPAGMIVMAGMTLPLHEKIAVQGRFLASLDGGVSAAEREQLDSIERDVESLSAALDGSGPDPAGLILGVPVGYHRDLAEHDPPVEAAELGLPVLVLQGGRDFQVTLEDFRGWDAALSSKPFACLVTYEKLDHLFRSGTGPSGPQDYDRQAPVDARVLEDISGWIHERRCPRRAVDP